MQPSGTSELWNGLRAGDVNALKELYNSFYHYLFTSSFAVCTRRDIVKDSIHEAFISIWINRDKLPPVTSVGGYLQTCVRRKMIDALQKEAPHEQVLPIPDDTLQECSYEEVIIAFQEQETTRQTLKEALSHLTTKQKEAIRLRFFENKSYEEIAQLADCEPRTIYNRMYEAVERLRHYFTAKHTS